MLYASYANKLESWEVTGLPEADPRLRKIASRNTAGFITRGNGRLFHEGMDVHQVGEKLVYFAAPHDFLKEKGDFVSPAFYTCQAVGAR